MFLKVVGFVSLLFLSFSCQKDTTYQSLQGNALGTTFSVKYDDPNNTNYSTSIDSLFTVVNHSLSTYHVNSLISQINNGDSKVKVDEHFISVFKKAKQIYTETDGAFDPTIGSLVNAWGFGPKKPLQNLDSTTVKDLMQLVGFNKVSLTNNIISKTNPEIFIDFNAIAKGYAVDVIGHFLEHKNCTNYMVEIGGEVRVRGVNLEGNLWRIGIEKPLTDIEILEYLDSLQDFKDVDLSMVWTIVSQKPGAEKSVTKIQIFRYHYNIMPSNINFVYIRYCTICSFHIVYNFFNF